MAKITLTMCDVKPCNRIAERDFELNGQTLHVCGEGCFVKYWSREYQKWKQDPYDLHIQYGRAEAQSSERVLKLITSNS